MITSEHESLQDRHLKYFPESMFAMKLDEYEEDCREFKKCGIDKTPLECHFLIGGCVYEDIIPFMCGCVDPDSVAREFYKALASRAWTDKNGEWHGHSHYEADGLSEQGILHLTMLYLLDHMGYTEHCSSVYSSWLTPKGVVARDILKAHFDCTLENNIP